MIPSYILFPVVGFFIGWVTNVLAIQFLFHPRKKIFGIQGIIPKRKKEMLITATVGELKLRVYDNSHQTRLINEVPLAARVSNQSGEAIVPIDYFRFEEPISEKEPVRVRMRTVDAASKIVCDDTAWFAPLAAPAGVGRR